MKSTPLTQAASAKLISRMYVFAVRFLPLEKINLASLPQISFWFEEPAVPGSFHRSAALKSTLATVFADESTGLVNYTNLVSCMIFLHSAIFS